MGNIVVPVFAYFYGQHLLVTVALPHEVMVHLPFPRIPCGEVGVGSGLMHIRKHIRKGQNTRIVFRRGRNHLYACGCQRADIEDGEAIGFRTVVSVHLRHHDAGKGYGVRQTGVPSQLVDKTGG